MKRSIELYESKEIFSVLKEKMSKSFDEMSVNLDDRRLSIKAFEELIQTLKNNIMFYINEEYGWFWFIESDVMKEYKHYFPASNASNLAEMFEELSEESD